jgi:hypothetical protein
MSDIYVDYIGSQSSRFLFPEGLSISQKNVKKPWVPREATLWTPELKEELLAFFTKLVYPFRLYEDIPFQDPLRSEIRRFLLSLDAYIESPNPVIPYRDILYGAADNRFSKYLKRIKRKSFETTWGAKHFATPDWWEEVPAYEIKDIGDIFNYSYLIHFKEESDDYKFGFIPVEIKPQRLAHFKEILTEILPERTAFEMIQPIEILSQLSGSIGVERGTMKHRPQYTIKDKYLSLSKIRHTCERSVISISPENCRDTVLNDPGDLNTISLIDQQLMEVLRVMPGHIHLRNKDRVTSRLYDLWDNYTFFLHRDIRKEGITKPRELLKAMLEVLHETYPDIPVFGLTSFYDNFALRVDGEIIYPKRGHGLGMANSLTTLMQLVIHLMNLDELQDDLPLIDSSALAINDDFVAGFKNLDDLEAYWDKEDEIMGELSIIRQPDKSFYSAMRFVLAERYIVIRREYEKISYQLRELLLPLACANVTHAKEYYIAAQTYVNSKLVPQYLGEIRNYWGYEFFPTEFIYPSKVGGWINEKINSVDMTLVILDQLDIKSYLFRGFKATNRKLQRKVHGEYYTPPILSLLGQPRIPKEYWDNFDILTYSQLNEKYGRILSRSPRSFTKFWESLYKVRQKEFKIPYEDTYEELLRMIINHYETTQFYPSESMIYRFHPCNYTKRELDDPYLDPNPHMAVVAKFNPSIQYPFRETFSIRFSNMDATTKKSQSLFSKEIQRTLKSESINILCTGKFAEVYYPSDSYKPEEQYLNPIKVGEVTAILNWGMGYPELKKGFEHPLIEEKRSVFGRLFTLSEIECLTREGLGRKMILSLSKYLSGHPKETLLGTIEFLKKFLYHPSVRETNVIEPQVYPDNYITIDRLLDENCAVVWSWRQNPNDFIVDSEETEHILRRLGLYIGAGFQTDPAFEANRADKRREIESGYNGPLITLLIHRSGISKLYNDEFFTEDADVFEEGLGGLFDG